ncbi:HEPN domain-containing protein [uncultured Thiocystis sp.]|jgi:uncharacterized protein (UPF0332 family)|uniref:HEPN domain-containing protein n=1 Tax=uncultured Thiocystis sp. TaxID=1202134 RepID=UPI0025E76CF7|nr:HEPN domain-containing protein [uncultured Thiocystis sp.]
MTANDYLEKAERALTSARLLLDSGDVEGACNRAYYAMFDAAHAALLASGAIAGGTPPKKHSSVIAAFGLQLVKTGQMAAELGSALNQVERLRRLADYTGEPITPEQAQWAVEQAGVFVAKVRQGPLCSTHHPPSEEP